MVRELWLTLMLVVSSSCEHLVAIILGWLSELHHKATNIFFIFFIFLNAKEQEREFDKEKKHAGNTRIHDRE
jgi:hypothetical protein